MHVNLDPFLVDKIVGEVKSQGVFDQFRRDSMSDVDTKPAYQNLRQRVEASVSKFLSDLKWKPETNKNQLREKLRKHITDAGFLDTGVERIVDQVVNPKIATVFQPKIEDIAYIYLGIEKPQNKLTEKYDAATNGALALKTDLLPNDLEAVSPDSEDKSNSKEDLIEPFNDAEEKNDEFESPPFEPLEGRPPTPIQDERSNQSHLSGISGLTSQDSMSSERELNFKKENCSMHESVLSQVSSSSRLSIPINDDEKVIKSENEAKPTADMSEEAQMPSFSDINDSKTKSTLHFDINKQEFKFEGTKSKFINSFYGKSKKSDLESSESTDKKNDKSPSNEISNSTSYGSGEPLNITTLAPYESLSKEQSSSTCEPSKMKSTTYDNNFDDTEKLISFGFSDKSTITCKKSGKNSYKIDSKKNKDEKSKSHHQKRTYKEHACRENQEKFKERIQKFGADEKNETKAKKIEVDDHSSYRVKTMKRRSTESDDEGEKHIQKTSLIVKQDNNEKARDPASMKNTISANAGKQSSESNGKTPGETSNLTLNKFSFDTDSTDEEEEEFCYFKFDALEEQNENEKIEYLSKLIDELLRKNKTNDNIHLSNVTQPRDKLSDIKELYSITQEERCDETNKRKTGDKGRETLFNEKRRKEESNGFHSTALPLCKKNVKYAKNFLPTDFSSPSMVESCVVDKEFNNAIGQNSSKISTIPFQAKISFRDDDKSKSAEVALKPPAEKKSLIAMKGTQRYSNEDLYKPRPALTNRPRRRFLDNEIA